MRHGMGILAHGELGQPLIHLTLLWQPDTVLEFNFSSLHHTLSEFAFPERHSLGAQWSSSRHIKKLA